MMRNKKGNLVFDSPTGLIIAVLCLLILGGVAILVWKVLVNDEYSRAQTAIDFIENKMSALKDAGQSTSFNIQSPCKEADKCEWFIYGWGKGNTMTDDRPERCYFNSCICICKGSVNKAKEVCQDLKTGICRAIKENVIDTSSYLNVIDMTLGFPNTQEYGANCRGIRLNEPLVELSLAKGKDLLLLVYSSGTQKRFSTACPDFVSSTSDNMKA